MTDSSALLLEEPQVRAFLTTYMTVDAAARIEFLSGGVSSAVVRVVSDDDCFVIKQALPESRRGAARC
jgi:hypothetical protein